MGEPANSGPACDTDEEGWMSLRYGVLGPLQVIRDSEALPLGGQKRRAVLAVLIAAAGRVVPIHDLLDAV